MYLNADIVVVVMSIAFGIIIKSNTFFWNKDIVYYFMTLGLQLL